MADDPRAAALSALIAELRPGEKISGKTLAAALAAAEQRGREQQRAADIEALRETVREQSSWLWYELGESALLRVAARLESLPLASGSPEGPETP